MPRALVFAVQRLEYLGISHVDVFVTQSMGTPFEYQQMKTHLQNNHAQTDIVLNTEYVLLHEDE